MVYLKNTALFPACKLSADMIFNNMNTYEGNGKQCVAQTNLFL